MGVYYMDVNSNAANFHNAGGSLTGSSTGSIWSTGVNSAIGTAVPTTRTFSGSADEMNFGSTSVASTTSGTLTLNANASVYAVRTTQLTGAQTISGSSTLTMSRADGVPVFSLQNELVINAPVGGTQGFDAFGAVLNLRNISNPITGPISGPLLFILPATGNANTLPNVTTITTSSLFLTGPTGATYTFSKPVFNVSNVGRWQINPTLIPTTGDVSSDLSGLTGTGVDSDGSLAVGPRAGFAPFGTGAGLHTVNFSGKLPSQVNYYFNYAAQTQAYGIVINYTGSQTNYPNTCLALVPNTSTQNRLEFNANQTSGGLTLGGGIQKYGPSGLTLTMKLGGTSTSDNTISGVISQTQTALAIEKIGPTRWIFTNTNTYTGGTTISVGALRASNNSALGTGNITLSTGTLELNGVSLTGPAALNATGTISAVSGVNSLSSDITLAGTTTVDVAGTSLTLSGLITSSGAPSFTKTGTGLATLSNTNNSFTSSPTISAGVLAVPALAALGAGTGLTLSGSGVLRYTGSSSGTLSRTVTGTSLTGGGFENDGNGTLAVTSGSLTGTVKLGGTGTGQFNTLGAAVSAGANGFTKEGAGRWIYTGGNASLLGTTSVTGTGTLMAAPPTPAAANTRLLGSTVTIGSNAGIQIGADNSQQGRNTYDTLTISAASGTPARIRIGGSAVNPTVQLAGNLALPTGSDKAKFDLSADVFKTPGEYTLIEFTGSFDVTGGSVLDNVEAVNPPAGRVVTFTRVAGSPNRIKVTIS